MVFALSGPTIDEIWPNNWPWLLHGLTPAGRSRSGESGAKPARLTRKRQRWRSDQAPGYRPSSCPTPQQVGSWPDRQRSPHPPPSHRGRYGRLLFPSVAPVCVVDGLCTGSISGQHSPPRGNSRHRVKEDIRSRFWASRIFPPRTGATNPARLPIMFIEPETVPAYLPPMSMQAAQAPASPDR